ncbi:MULTISPECIES: peptidoglycan bridge formation glycyltransferase FemA/FemB family protein [unclassified Prochlorococcus]|uniref:peptidoglycan bridge formation glycyltransferase FemA/FemB family protein n=1 Tax=unclassified Prochlorococcus TaxID=2627481 RepID=UPI00187C00A1|nr:MULTISPECIES: peptidoglycan bridge formation glycyltransferase FemA/FemB family protein [unclassified Prochlorococcus]
MPHIQVIKKDSVDILVFIQSGFITKKSFNFNTLIIDLSRDLDSIWSKMKKNYRYEINRSKNKDGLEVVIIDKPTKKDVELFSKFFDEFANSRSIRTSNKRKLYLLQESGNLVIAYSGLKGSQKHPLTAHCYIHDSERVRLYHSCSNIEYKIKDRNLVARSNKLLHWDAIVKFKSLGFSIYDFGGISKNNDLEGIDRFKLGFNGKEVKEYSTLMPSSALGYIILFIYDLIKVFR